MRLVLDARYAARPGGISTYVRAVGSRVAAMPGRAYSLRFWIGADADPIAENAPNVTHHLVRSGRASLSTLLYPCRLDALQPGDVFHAPANVLGFGLRCRTIVTVHDILWLTHPALCQPRRWARPISRHYFGVGMRHGLQTATRILTVTHASADEIARYSPGAHSRLVVIPNAADPEFHPPQSRSEAARRAAEILGDDRPYVLVLGHNQASKGHRYALEAFAALRPGPERLVFVQRMHRDGELSRLANRLGVAARVAFLPALPRPALVPLMQSARALIQPSLAEGFGIPVVEAMAAGCPVIASDIPALREVLGGAGLLAAPGSASEIARALRRLCDEPGLRDELRARGLERAPAYSWDKTAQLTDEVYRDVLC